MSYQKLTPVIAKETTEHRYLEDRFADVVNVKDYGAVGDGTTDDTQAFTDALAFSRATTQAKVFVPRGEYVVSTSTPISQFFGDGTLIYPTGHRVSLSNCANNNSLVHRYICELNLSSEKVTQDVSICDGYIFVSQQVSGTAYASNAVVRITKFAYPTTEKSVSNLRPQSIASDALTEIEHCDFTGLGHGEGVQAIKINGQIYIYTQYATPSNANYMNFAKIEWHGANSSIQTFNGLDCVQAQISVSIDGKYILTCSIENEPSAHYKVSVFDRNTVETAADVSSVAPIYRWTCKGSDFWYSRSGLACDGQYVYISHSGAHAATSSGLRVFTLSGLHVKDIRFDHLNAILGRKTKRSWNGYYVSYRENEGIGIVDDKLVIMGKLIWCIPTSFCKWNGNTFFAKNYGGKSPAYAKQWAITEQNVSGIQDYNASATYTNPSFSRSMRCLISIEPMKGKSGEYPLIGNGWMDEKTVDLQGSGLTTLVNDSNGMFLFGTRVNGMSAIIPYATLNWNGQLALYDPRAMNKFDIGTNSTKGCYQYDVEADQLLMYQSSSRVVSTVVEEVDPVSGETVRTREYSTEETNGSGRIRLYESGGQNNPERKHNIWIAEDTAQIRLCGSQSNDPGAVHVHTGTNLDRAILFTSDQNTVVYGNLYPRYTETQNLGGSNNRWENFYVASGGIHESDERVKRDIASLPDEVLNAWGDINWVQFKFKSAYEKKGSNARIHTGVVAQQVLEAFASRGLDATQYGLLCHDIFKAEDAEYIDVGEDVTEMKLSVPAKPAGDIWSVRYAEALVMEVAYLRKRISELEERVNQLTNNNNNNSSK